jgi:hypothetical protein
VIVCVWCECVCVDCEREDVARACLVACTHMLIPRIVSKSAFSGNILRSGFHFFEPLRLILSEDDHQKHPANIGRVARVFLMASIVLASHSLNPVC